MKGKYPYKDDEGNIIWKNLFKMDKMSVIFLIIVVLLIVAFKYDTGKCQEIYEKPYSFCSAYCEEFCMECDYDIKQDKTDPLFNYSINSVD